MSWPGPNQTMPWNPAAMLMPDMMNNASYTPEQWALMQQQNWQQWTQWQQQISQWQNQYGNKFVPISAVQNIGGIPPLPPSGVVPPPPPDIPPPPPPHENNQPLFNIKKETSDPVSESTQQRNNSKYNTNSSIDNNSKWSSGTDNQQPAVNADALRKLAEEERLFDIQFQKWEQEIDKWRQENVNHPDKQAYKDYEAKFEGCRKQLLERRQQMKMKRAALLNNPVQTNNTGNTTVTPPKSLNQSNYSQNSQMQQKLQNNYENQNDQKLKTQVNHQTNSFERQFNPSSRNKNIEPQDRHESYHQNVSESNNYSSHRNHTPQGNKSDNSTFLPTASSEKGIPGLDLVPDPRADIKLEVIDITGEHPEIVPGKDPDYSTISMGINNILGDEKIMNILSMVHGFKQSLNTEFPNASQNEFKNENQLQIQTNNQGNRNQNFSQSQQFGERPGRFLPKQEMNSQYQPPNQGGNYNRQDSIQNADQYFDQSNQFGGPSSGSNMRGAPSNHCGPGGPSGLGPHRPGMQQGPGIRHPGMHQGGPGMQQGGPGLQGGLGMHQGGPGMHQGGPGMQQGGPRMMQNGLGMQQGPGVRQNMQHGGPNMQQKGTNIQQSAHNMQQNGPNIQQGGPNMQQCGPNMQQGHQNLLQGGPNMQRGGPNMQLGGLNIQQGGQNNQQPQPLMANKISMPVQPSNAPVRHPLQDLSSHQSTDYYGSSQVSIVPSQQPKPKWLEDPLFTPSIVVEYEHKSLRLKARDFIEPVHTFDYNHISKDNDVKKKDFEYEADDLFIRKPRRSERDYAENRFRDHENRDVYSRDYERRGTRDDFRDMPKDIREIRGESRDMREHRDNNRDEPRDARDRDYMRESRDFRERDIRGRDDISSRDRPRDVPRDDFERRRDDRHDDRRRDDLDRHGNRRIVNEDMRDRDSNRDYKRDGRRDDYRDTRRDDNRIRSTSRDKDSRKRGLSRESEVSNSSKKMKDVKERSNDVNDVLQNKRIVMIDDLLEPPGRDMRPDKIVIILRGLPGSGKSYLAKLIRDREAEHGGTSRIMSIDDYFMQEGEIEETDSTTGKTVKKPSLKYEYDAASEETYINSLKRAFRRTLTDGYFSFLIYDAVNSTLSSYADIWNFSRQNGFQVYICTMEQDVHACFKRNIHNRKLEEIEVIASRFFPTPTHHIHLDATTLLQNAAITDVQMEDVDDVIMDDGEIEPEVESVFTSKWEKMDDATKLARLDGTSRPLRPSQLSMEDYLQLDDWTPNKAKPGKKTVRWADLEERRQQEKMRAIGFVVGQTDWNRMTDPTMGSSALTQTKYIERVRRN